MSSVNVGPLNTVFKFYLKRLQGLVGFLNDAFEFLGINNILSVDRQRLVIDRMPFRFLTSSTLVILVDESAPPLNRVEQR